jgi:hypothetical protein
MTTSVISHSFLIQDIAFRGIPTPKPVFNELDYHGSILGLQRLPEEKNALYKKRLLDVYVNKANASYTGLINGITRELGIEFFKPITITVKSGIDLSLSPRIEFKDNNVYLWSDSFTKELELTINRSDKTLPEYFLGGLVEAINQSDFFEAVLNSEEYRFQRSDCIVNESSSKLVSVQQLNFSRVNHLQKKNIDKGSLIFSDIQTFRTEVANIALVSSPGKYFIDYQQGVLTSFTIPNDSAVIQYSYREDNFIPRASPVIIRSINSEEFSQTLFNQIQQTTDLFTNGAITSTGASIVNELLSVVPIYWGE